MASSSNMEDRLVTVKPVTASWRDIAGDQIAFLLAVSAAAPHPLVISRWDLDKEAHNGLNLRGMVEWAMKAELVSVHVEGINDRWLALLTTEGTRRAQAASKPVPNS